MEKKSKLIIYFISYISIFFIGIVLLLDLIFGTKLGAVGVALNNISKILCFVVVFSNAFFFVRTKRSNLFMLLLIVFSLICIICFFIPLVK